MARARSPFALSLVVALLATFIAAAPAAGEAEASYRAPVDAPLLSAQGRASALVHVRADRSLADGIAAARAAGLSIGTRFARIKVFAAHGPASRFRALARDRAIEAIEANRRLRYFTDTSHAATRGRDVLEGAVTLPDGTRIDGSGVGVAVVDSGIDGSHPDLEDRVGGNIKIVCASNPPGLVVGATAGMRECLTPMTAVELQDTDTASAGGHGTHVSGIIAGTGAASEGTFHGAAPGATLYGISVGEVVTVEHGVAGLMWVLENHDVVSPEIKVVNNSWGSGHSPYNPESGPFHRALWKAQEALVADGVTVVFAAGNAGQSGNNATTSGECVNPTPGVVCVANYTDNNNGTRSGSISGSSSRGSTADALTWPDVSAPGTQIVATCRAHLPVCATGLRTATPNTYSSLSGTSMASPHVAGIAAQLYQANPDLTPAQVEHLLETTAHKFTFGAPYGADPANPDSLSSRDKGHGLVDALAAVQEALVTEPGEATSGRYEAFGTIRASNVASADAGGITEAAFLAACSVPPQPIQGTDGYVFEVPASFAAGGAVATASGLAPANFYDLDAYFYSEECDLLGDSATTEANESAEVPEGTRYVVVNAFLGQWTLAHLVLRTGDDDPDPTPSPTPTASPTPSPSPTGPPEVPDEVNIDDPFDDANYVNDQGLFPAVFVGNANVGNVEEVADLGKIWFTNTADSITAHVQTKAKPPADRGLFFRVQVIPEGATTRCLWFQASTEGAGNIVGTAASLRQTCDGDTTVGGSISIFDGPDGTGIMSLTFPFSAHPALGPGRVLAAPAAHVRNFAAVATAPQPDHTEVGDDYQITGDVPDPTPTPTPTASPSPTPEGSITITSPEEGETVEQDFVATGTTGGAEAAASAPEQDRALRWHRATRDVTANARALEAELGRLPGFVALVPVPDGSKLVAVFDQDAPATLPRGLVPDGWSLDVHDNVRFEPLELEVDELVEMPTTAGHGPPVPEDSIGIGPGSTLLINRGNSTGLCTAAFIFRDRNTGKVYLGTAGHCFLPDNGISTHGDDANFDPRLVTRVRVCVANCIGGQLGVETGAAGIYPGTTRDLGPLAYARQQTAGADVGHDFGIVEIPQELWDEIRTDMPVWNGPATADTDRNVQLGDTIVHYGNSIVMGEVFPTKGRAGIGSGANSQRWIALSPAGPGDSGSAVNIATVGTDFVEGQWPAGILTHLFCCISGGMPHITGGTTTARAIQMAAQDAGIQLELIDDPAKLEVEPPPPPTLSVEVRLLRGEETLVDWTEVDTYDGTSWEHSFSGIEPGGTTLEARLLEDDIVAATDAVGFVIRVPELATEIAFTDDSDTSGQFTDSARFEAELRDEDGAPVEGAEVAFTLFGDESVAEWSAVTDAAGIATRSVVLDGRPGDYQLHAEFSGIEDEYTGSFTATSFHVRREDTVANVAVEGRGVNRTIHASLVDEDTPMRGVGGATLLFFADGEFIGEAVTEGDGTASLVPPPRYRGGNHEFEVVFEGDDSWRASRAATRP